MAPIKGINVPGTIVPFTDQDTYPTHDSLYGIGGWREVPDTATRDAIPVERLRAGMVVYVQGDKSYVYNGVGWDVLVPASASSIATLTDVTLTSLTSGQILQWNGSAWVNVATPSATPGGLSTHLQFNDGGFFAGALSLTWDKVNNLLTLNGGILRPEQYTVIDITTLTGYPGSAALSAAQNNNFNAYEFTGLIADDSIAFAAGARGPFFVFNNSNFNLSLLPVGGGSTFNWNSGFLPPKTSGLFYIDSSNNMGLATSTGSGQLSQGESLVVPATGFAVQLDNQGFPLQAINNDLTVDFDGSNNSKLNVYDIAINHTLIGPAVVASDNLATSGAPVLSLYGFYNGSGTIAKYAAYQAAFGAGNGSITDGAMFALFNDASVAALGSHNPISYPGGSPTVDNFAGFKVVTGGVSGVTNLRAFYSQASEASIGSAEPGTFDFYGDGLSLLSQLALGVNGVFIGTAELTPGINLVDGTLGGFTVFVNPGANGSLFYIKNVGTANTIEVQGLGGTSIDGGSVFLAPGDAVTFAYDRPNTIFRVLANGSSGASTATEIQVNGVDTASQTPINFVNSSTIAITNPGTGQISIALTVPGTDKQIIYNNSGAFGTSSSFLWDNGLTPKKLTVNGEIETTVTIDSAANNNVSVLTSDWSLVNTTSTATPSITGPFWSVAYGGTVTPGANANISGGGIFASSQDSQTDSISAIIGWQVLAASGENVANHGSISAIQAFAQNHSNGTTTTVEAVETQLRLIRPSTMTTAAAIHCLSPNMAAGSGSATVGTYAQLLIEDPTNANITGTPYAIKVSGGVVDLGPSTTRIGSNAPANSSSAGVAGTITWDTGFLYICTSPNTWKRAALSTF